MYIIQTLYAMYILSLPLFIYLFYSLGTLQLAMGFRFQKYLVIVHRLIISYPITISSVEL